MADSRSPAVVDGPGLGVNTWCGVDVDKGSSLKDFPRPRIVIEF